MGITIKEVLYIAVVCVGTLIPAVITIARLSQLPKTNEKEIKELQKNHIIVDKRATAHGHEIDKLSHNSQDIKDLKKEVEALSNSVTKVTTRLDVLIDFFKNQKNG